MTMPLARALRATVFTCVSLTSVSAVAADSVQIGPRPLFLVDVMEDGALKDKLKGCMAGPFARSDWSIGHRGAPMQFPEHTRESYVAAARMGAGILECDVAFTKDKELVCRHAQNDLHTTTNILTTGLAGNCTRAFTPAQGEEKASAECRTSDITLAEFTTLKGKMDAGNAAATTAEDYQNATAAWRTDLYTTPGTLMAHKDSIALFKELGVKFTPELKTPAIEMPFDGFTQEMYAQKMIDEYKEAGVNPADVFAQSFRLEDVLYWIKNEPEFGKQAVYLDDSDETFEGFDHMKPETWEHSMADLKAMGVNYIAPPIWMLLTTDGSGNIVPSAYAKEAKAAGLNIISWTAERSGPLASGGGWYYQSMEGAIDDDGDVYKMMDVLANQIGVVGLFSDWPATTTFFANCMGLGDVKAN